MKRSLIALLVVVYAAVPALAVKPTADLLPNTTKVYVSLPDPDETIEKWNACQLGQLANDPLMEPFSEDFQDQLSRKLNEAGRQLNLTWDDIKDVYGGEVCFAKVQPDGDASQHASAVIVDVTGHLPQTDVLLKKIDANMRNKRATVSRRRVGAVRQTVYRLPPAAGQTVGKIGIISLHENQLVATDHDKLSIWIASRFTLPSKNTLARIEAFKHGMTRVAAAAGDRAPHIRWFAEPFGMIEINRAEQGQRRRRGTDMLKVLSAEGFRAIQGAAGYVNFATEDHEMLHRTKVYAPPTASDGDDKYTLGARILNFPNGGDLSAQNWIPRQLASYGTFNWPLQKAFYDSFTLVDEYAGEDGFFQDLLDSLKDDPDGPQLDVPNELVEFLDDRATLVLDYVEPITTTSERKALALEVTDRARVAAAVRKAFEDDPEARRLEYKGHEIWEIINEPQEVAHDTPAVTVSAPFNPFPEDDQPPEAEDERRLPNSAITVAQNHLIVGSHIDLVKKILDVEQDDSLPGSVEYKKVDAMLIQLGAAADSFRMFSRTDEEYHVTYELFRQGKMPEAETMLGGILNQMLRDEDTPKDQLREAELDGSKLPDYQVARKYLGPAGSYVRTEDDGWLLTGALLTKLPENVPANARRSRDSSTPTRQ